MARQRIYDDEETVHLSVRLPFSIISRIKELALKNRRSTNQQIVLLLQTALEVLDQAQDSKEKRSSQ